MNTRINQMLRAYHASSLAEQKNCLREVAQEVILCGLSRAGFFQEAAFYGGTALRIFHGLDRFSEDMDFSLLKPNQSFELEPYLPFLERECDSWGLRFSAAAKPKRNESPILSAFLKADTKEHLITLFAEDALAESVPAGELLRIKIEIDTDPAPYASFERKYRLLPSPYEANLYDASSLFAGKIHAVLCRAWKNRIKGRDLYDYVFHLSQNTPVNLAHLSAKLIQTDHLGENEELTLSALKKMLAERFDSIDYRQAKEDVRPFVRDEASLDVWSSAFFKSITEDVLRQLPGK